MAEQGTVHVLALFTAAPGKESELKEALTALIEPTRREAGCIRYDLVRGLGKPAEFAFIEEWESAAHLDAHSQTAHVREAGAKAAGLLGTPASIERYRQIG
jgi:quinol monooxygenase YgiN